MNKIKCLAEVLVKRESAQKFQVEDCCDGLRIRKHRWNLGWDWKQKYRYMKNNQMNLGTKDKG